MKGQFRKAAAVLLLLTLMLSSLSVTAGAAMITKAEGESAAVSTEAAEAVVDTDSFVKSRAESVSQLDISAAKWKNVGGNWRLKSHGKYKTGFVKYKGSYYYFNSSGNLVVGFFKSGGKTYFASRTTGAKGKGKILTGLRKIDGYYYYLSPSKNPHKGAVMTGFQKINNRRYYFNSAGRMQTGWIQVSGSWYYGSTASSSLGVLLTGTHKIGTTTYQFDSNGRRIRTVSIASASSAPASSRYQHFLDISEHQRSIDFNKVKKAGIKGVIIRCGYGKFDKKSNHTDKYFFNNIKKAKAAGLSVGIYWFSYAYNRQQAVNEANYCVNLIKTYKINLPVYFDWEYDSMTKAKRNMGSKAFKNTKWRKNITDMTAAFCNTVTQKGYRAGYYFNLHYLNTYYDTSKLKKYSTWYAFWGSNKPGSNIWNHANTMKTPTAYDLWQFTSRGKVNGISGYVDCDLLLKPSIKK